MPPHPFGGLSFTRAVKLFSLLAIATPGGPWRFWPVHRGRWLWCRRWGRAPHPFGRCGRSLGRRSIGQKARRNVMAYSGGAIKARDPSDSRSDRAGAPPPQRRKVVWLFGSGARSRSHGSSGRALSAHGHRLGARAPPDLPVRGTRKRRGRVAPPNIRREGLEQGHLSPHCNHLP